MPDIILEICHSVASVSPAAVEMRILCLLMPALLLVVAKRNPLPPGARGRPRIVGGKSAHQAQFAHHALVVGDMSFLCGGSLIAPTKVLTAAHCTIPYNEYYIRLGGIHLDVYEENAWATVTPWAVVHPRYDAVFYNHDVAVVFLKEPAPLNRYINVVGLPSRREIKDTFTGQHAIISGWGKTSDAGNISMELQWASLTVVPNEMCSKFYPQGYVSESTLCAWGDKAGICSGDSGGALVIKTHDGYKQIGVNSFSEWRGCETSTPNGFVRVTSVLEWITRMAADDS